MLRQDTREAAAGHADVVGIGVRWIPLRRQADTPAFVGVDGRGHVVEILALGIGELAEAAGVVDLPHGVRSSWKYEVSNIMYLRPLALTVSNSSWASSSEPNTAGIADATCLPCLSARCNAGRDWGVGGDEHGFDAVVFDHFLQRRIGLAHGSLARPAQRSGTDRSPPPPRHSGGSGTEGGAELAHAVTSEPTRILRSETGFQPLEASGVVGAFSKPWITYPDRAAGLGPARAAEPRPSVCRKERRVRRLTREGFSDAPGSGPVGVVASWPEHVPAGGRIREYHRVGTATQTAQIPMRS